MSDKAALSMTELLSVEDDPRILEFYCSETGVLLWPYIRSLFFRMIMSDLLYDVPMPTVSPSRSIKLRALITLSRAIVHNARAGLPDRSGIAEVCLMTSGIGMILEDGVWFNRLSDYFATEAKAITLTVEDNDGWSWYEPRVTKFLTYRAPQQVRLALAEKIFLRESHKRQAAQVVGLVRDRAKSLLNWELGADRETRLVATLAGKAAALPYSARRYRSMLLKMSPKVLIREAACYGPSACLMAVAKDLKITTAEYQHGAISAGHDAYNLAQTLCASEQYRRSLPDYLLSYGHWWTDQINIPVKRVLIGNPHREKQIERCSVARTVDSGARVLILGDGIDTDRYLELARLLTEGLAASGFRIVFRPHPLERADLASRDQHGKLGVEIDEYHDIYSSLRAAYTVASELSTGLFEAVGLVERIFLWNTTKARFAFPVHPFQAFDTASELVSLIQTTSAGKVSPGLATDLWAPNWTDNYRKFLSGCGVNMDHAPRQS